MVIMELYGCNNITTVGIQNLMQGWSNLKGLGIGESENISVEDYRRVKETYPRFYLY